MKERGTLAPATNIAYDPFRLQGGIKMIPIVLFVGKSGSGKTTLVEQVIAELVRRGRRVAAIKHAAHAVGLDQPGKDSARFSAAGAAAVAIVGQDQVGFYRRTPEEWNPETLRDRLFEDVDVIVGEGFKEARLPKVAVVRRAAGLEEDLDRAGLLAVATDTELAPELRVPRYSLADISGLADLVESQIQTQAGKREVTLHVNGRRITIKPFIKDFFLNTISAMVDSLKDTEDARRIVIAIDRSAQT